MCRSMVDVRPAIAEIRRGKKDEGRKMKETTLQNIMLDGDRTLSVYSIRRPDIVSKFLLDVKPVYNFNSNNHGLRQRASNILVHQ